VAKLWLWCWGWWVEKLGVDMGLESQLETMMLSLKDATSLSLPSNEICLIKTFLCNSLNFLLSQCSWYEVFYIHVVWLIRIYSVQCLGFVMFT
jgi:hypothetical protein